MKFGESTPSYDAALLADETAPWDHVTIAQIERLLRTVFRNHYSASAHLLCNPGRRGAAL